MKYEVEFRQNVLDLLIAWEPPDSVLNELERLFDEHLPVDPVNCLHRISAAGAMQYTCTIPERGSSRVHVFLFRVHYGEDEKTLFVYDAFYYPLPG